MGSEGCSTPEGRKGFFDSDSTGTAEIMGGGSLREESPTMGRESLISALSPAGS